MKGVDVSSWQHPGNKPIDWHAVADDGYTFALVKATQGTSYVNPWLERDLDDAFAAGLLVGAYHYFEPGLSPDAQAHHFVSALIGRRLELGTWLDYEVGSATVYTVSAEVNAFVATCADGRPGTGVYLDAAQWDELREAGIALPKLWVADWSVEAAPRGALLWQSGQKTVAGIEGPADVDVLTSARGLNIPTSPPARPSAATAGPPASVAQGHEDDGHDGVTDNASSEEEVVSQHAEPAGSPAGA